MISKNESSDYLSQFCFEEKNDYNWSIIGLKKQIDSDIIKSGLFEGASKSNKNSFIYVKQYFIDSENQNELKNILKEVFLFKTFQNQNYFPPNIKYSLSKDEKNLFISFKGNYVSLNAFLNQ